MDEMSVPSSISSSVCSQWEGLSMHSRCLAFFHFKFFWGAGKDREGLFFIFLGSQCVPIMFPLISRSAFIRFSVCSSIPNMFPIMSSTAPHFYPIWFGKCYPPFTYIRWAKGRKYFKIISPISGSLHSFSLPEWWANQIGSSHKKKKNLGGTSFNSTN